MRSSCILLIGLFLGFICCGGAGGEPPKAPLAPRLDTGGGYLILSTEAARDYTGALDEARKLHPDAAEAVFSPADFAAAREAMLEHGPRYVLVLIHPDELDVNFAWRWLKLTSELDGDPFVDARTGFVTGETPAAAAAFLRRTGEAVSGRANLPGLFVENFGPNTMAPKSAFNEMPQNFMIPVFGERFGLKTISHGTQGFTNEQMESMDGAGLVHFGGHGYPDRIVDGLNGPWVRKLKLSPCVVFNGACYTGVTGTWYEMKGSLKEQMVPPQNSFCLGILGNQAVAYLAALHPDHGIPVYQEMEFLATSGTSLGDVMKHTHDGVILGNGGQLPEFETFTDGMAGPGWTPSDFMLKGTAARVLFGDPALVPMRSFTGEPFEITSKADGSGLRVTAILKNTALKSTYTDTYHADLASDPNLFNDRALITCELPEDLADLVEVKVLRVEAGGKELRHRLVGYGVEETDGRRLLHVQVDVPTKGYMDSDFRSAGATIELQVGSVP